MEEKFGFCKRIITRLPPHGGIAFGIDRIVMMFKNESIRDVIAFQNTISIMPDDRCAIANNERPVI